MVGIGPAACEGPPANGSLLDLTILIASLADRIASRRVQAAPDIWDVSFIMPFSMDSVRRCLNALEIIIEIIIS